MGIDTHKGMVDWCRDNLTPVDSNFQFFHHDVYSPVYGVNNSLKLAEPFPVWDEEFSLVIDELDPTQAVIYDRDWFLDTIRSCGLSVQQTIYPPMPGHQWNVLLTRRTPNAVDEFPLGELGAEWLCGTTQKPMAKGGYFQ